MNFKTNSRLAITPEFAIYFKTGYSYSEDYMLEKLDALYLSQCIWDDYGNIKTATTKDTLNFFFGILRTRFLDENSHYITLYSIVTPIIMR